jgi:hypothetical protein
MQLIENWQETKEALLEGLQGSKKTVMGTLIENQKQHLLETAAATANTASSIGNFQKIAIPMIRRILPGTISSDLVGVQPMSGPVGLVYSLRFAFAEAADAAGTGNDIVAGDEVFANNSKMKRFYSSADVGTAGYPPALTAATTDGFAAQTADFEGFGGKSMLVHVSFKLAGLWKLLKTSTANTALILKQN